MDDAGILIGAGGRFISDLLALMPLKLHILDDRASLSPKTRWIGLRITYYIGAYAHTSTGETSMIGP